MAMHKVTLFLALFLTVAFGSGSDSGSNNLDSLADRDTTRSGPRQYRDVCIVGGGAAGAAAAVFLRDLNFSVLVVEKQGNLGGHCDTVNFTPPPIPGLPNWVDIGVGFWPKTDVLNNVNLGPWDVDTAAFVSRFHPFGPAGVLTVDLSAPSASSVYNFNFNSGTMYSVDPTTHAPKAEPPFPSATPNATYTAAFNAFFDIVNKTYHWISLNEYPTNWYPDRIPNDLLQPFSQFITQHHLEPLLPLFQAFLNPSGLGTWDITPAIWCVLALPPSILHNFRAPNAGFIVTGGCQLVYDGIYNFLGPSNVALNSVVTDSNRKLISLFGKPAIKIDVQNTVTNVITGYSCDKLIIAHPQTTANLDYANLDILEELVFDQVKTRYYFNGIAPVTDGVLSGGGLAPFQIRNTNTGNPFNQPSFPGLISLGRNFPFAPASILGVSDTPMTNAAFAQLAATQIARLQANNSPPLNYLTATVNLTNYHEYQPYPVNDAINHPFGFYTQLRALQGHRNTYYIGTLASYAGSYLVWEQAYDLIKREFA